jgi:hypothetical protein
MALFANYMKGKTTLTYKRGFSDTLFTLRVNIVSFNVKNKIGYTN